MTQGSRALRLGVFLLSSLAVVVAAVFVLSGGRWLTRTDSAVMHFRGSTYGLQVGAPVVFRGVRVGTVQSIGLRYDEAHRDYAIPVVAELEHAQLLNLLGPEDARGGDTVARLVARGLRAQLGTQSLLTGQLYIDLDLRGDRESLALGSEDARRPEIPTTPTPFQALKDQLDGVDVRALIRTFTDIADATRSLVQDARIQETAGHLASLTATLERMATRMDGRVDGLADQTQRSLRDIQRAARQVDRAALSVRGTAGLADRALAPDGPLLRDARASMEELRQALAAVHAQAGEDSELMLNANRALDDVARASRAVKDLAELLERQPQAVLRGPRATEENTP